MTNDTTALVLSPSGDLVPVQVNAIKAANLAHLLPEVDQAVILAQIKAAQRAYTAFEEALRAIGDLPPVEGETIKDLNTKAARAFVKDRLHGVEHAAWDSGDMLSDFLDLFSPDSVEIFGIEE